MALTGNSTNRGFLRITSILTSMIWLLLFTLDRFIPVVSLSTNNVVLSNDGRLATFKGLLDRAGISPTIGKTIFGPTKGAFNDFRSNYTRYYDQWMTQTEFFVHFKLKRG